MKRPYLDLVSQYDNASDKEHVERAARWEMYDAKQKIALLAEQLIGMDQALLDSLDDREDLIFIVGRIADLSRQIGQQAMAYLACIQATEHS